MSLAKIVFYYYYIIITARHQSDGNVHLRTRSKRFQTSRNSIDSRKSDMSMKNHLGKVGHHGINLFTFLHFLNINKILKTVLEYRNILHVKPSVDPKIQCRKIPKTTNIGDDEQKIMRRLKDLVKLKDKRRMKCYKK